MGGRSEAVRQAGRGASGDVAGAEEDFLKLTSEIEGLQKSLAAMVESEPVRTQCSGSK